MVAFESGGFGDLLFFRLRSGIDTISLGEEAVYSLIVIGIVGTIVGVVGIVGDWSVGGNLLLDPFPIT